MSRNFFLVGFLTLCGCSFTNGNSETREIPYTAPLNYRNEFAISLSGKVDRYFGMHTIRVDSVDRLLYMNDAKQLVFLDPVVNTSFQIDFSGYAGGLQVYTASVSGNSLFFLNLDSLILYGFTILEKKRLIEQKKVKLNELIELYTPAGLYSQNAPNKQFIRFQGKQTFKLSQHFLYIAYGLPVHETHFLDKFAYLKIDLNDSPAVAKKTFSYPLVFREGKYDDDHTFLNFFSNGDCLYSFSSYDSVYKFDQAGKVLTVKILNSNARFRVFNRKKRRDLGYIRIYTVTNEANTVMVTGQKDEVLVIRHLAKDKLSDPDQFDMYLLDSLLNIKYKNTLPFRAHYFHHTNFGKGFLVFNAGMDKAYYYETP